MLTPSKQAVTNFDVDQSTNNANKIKRPRRLIIREFCLNTSTHALPGIARSESVYNRLFWSISFIAFTSIMIFFVVKAILDYFSYPTNIDLSIISEWPQYFPAVSICNGSPVQLNKFSEPFLNFVRSRNLTSSNTTDFSAYDVSIIAQFSVDYLNRNQPIEQYFFTLPSMMYYCLYNSRPCSVDDFISFTWSNYGACFTFNPKLKDSYNKSVRYANQYGGEGTLELGFYIHRHQYAPIYGAFGMVALIHDNAQFPLVDKAGIELAPGRKHKLGFRKQTSYFLSPPYTTCTNKISSMMEAMFDNYNGADYVYSETICYQLCGQVYAYEQCGCVSPNLWSGRTIVKPGTDQLFLAPVCDFMSKCFANAIDRLLSSTELMKKYCSNCSQQCKITNFIVQTSSLEAPAEWELEDIKKFVENSTVPLSNNWSTNWREEIYKNLVGVTIVRETNVVENNTQSAKIGVVDILSNVGGQTGLWIGISFLSIMEFIETIYRLIRHEFILIYHRCLRKQ